MPRPAGPGGSLRRPESKRRTQRAAQVRRTYALISVAQHVASENQMLESFYSTVAQASFTLLGLWWVLLQIRHDEWIGDAPYRQSVYDISFYFLLLGMMSLASLL